jgi:ABC-type lipoprotein export system ATPase subunit
MMEQPAPGTLPRGGPGMVATAGATTVPAVEAIDVQRIYKVGSREVPALRGISMRVEPGEFVALKGRSGSGKTTLLNAIGGLDQPTSGKVLIFGQDTAKMSDRHRTHWRAQQVGFIFQSFGLLPTLSAYENVELMLRIAGKGRKIRHDRTMYCLDLVGLGKWIHHRPSEMSGGQQQRVAIARALANEPHLILADEPTGELDSTTGREILGMFQKICAGEDVTMLMATHDPLVDDYVDRIVQLKDGQIVDPGT